MFYYQRVEDILFDIILMSPIIALGLKHNFVDTGDLLGLRQYFACNTPKIIYAQYTDSLPSKTGIDKCEIVVLAIPGRVVRNDQDRRLKKELSNRLISPNFFKHSRCIAKEIVGDSRVSFQSGYRSLKIDFGSIASVTKRSS